MTFSQPGQYTFDVKVKAIPTGQPFKKVSQQAQKQAVPLNIQKDQISGQVTGSKNQILATTIPYSKGWHSANNQVIKINEGFVGITLHTGKNDIL